MVFNPPTTIDNTNSDRYSFERTKLLIFNYYLKYMPHIFSHMGIEIMHNRDGAANNGVDSLRFIYVNFLSTKEFCSQIRCQNKYPRGQTCTSDSSPIVFKSGNSDIQACQSGCYNLYSNKFAKNQQFRGDEFRGPFTIWSDRMSCCQLHTNSAFALGIDDYLRTDVHPTPRIDTIGTGYDLDKNLHIDDSNNESFRFKINKYYCDDFELEFDGTKCKESVGEYLFSLFVSQTLYKAVQYGVRYFSTGVSATTVNTPKLPDISTQPSLEYSKWMTNINPDATFFNPDLSLADLGITRDKLHLIFTTEFGWPGRLVEPLILTKEIDNNVMQRDFVQLNKFRPAHLQVNPTTGRRYNDSFDLLEIYKYINEAATINPDTSSSEGGGGSDIHADVFESIREFITNIKSSDILGAVSAAVIIEHIEKAISGMRAVSATIESEFITTTMLKIARRVVVHELAPAVLMGSLRILSLTLQLMSSTLKAGSVVLNVIAFLDLFLQFADFFHLQRLQDQGYVDAYTILDLETNFRCFGYRTVEMSPVHVISMMENLNMPDKFKVDVKNDASMYNAQWAKLKCVQKNYIQQPYEIPHTDVVDRNDFNMKILWTAEYIYALKTNSNGLKIDWADDTRLVKATDDSLTNIKNTTDIETFVQYQKFAKNFTWKYKYLRLILPCCLFVIIFYMVGVSWLASLVLLVISIVVHFITFKID